MAGKKELKPSDPNFLPTEYGLTKHGLGKLKKEYDPALIPDTTEKGDEGYLVVHEKVMKITKVRTAIEAKRKELKADSLAWGKKVDAVAKELTQAVLDIEKPWKTLKTDLDEKEAREAEEARKVEAERIALIEEKVRQLKTGAEGLLGLPVSRLQERMRTLESVEIDATYGEYQEAAEHHKTAALVAISQAITERQKFEEEQAALKAQQDAMAEQQRKLDEQQAAIDKEKAEREAQEAAERQEKEDAAFAELEEKQRQEKAAELKKRMPDDLKIREYALALLSVKIPKVKDEELKKLVNTLINQVAEVATYAFAHTQESEPTEKDKTVLEFKKEK